MNKSDLVRHVAEETGMTGAAAEAAVNAMLSGIAASTTPTFKAGKQLRDAVNAGGS